MLVFLLIQIILVGVCTAEEDVVQPQGKAIQKSTVVPSGEDKIWAIEKTTRQERRYPSNSGQVGLFRLRSAESLPEGTFSFGIGGQYYATQVAPDFGSGNRQANTIAESIFVGFSPTDNLTLALARRNSSTTFGNPKQLISSLGDFDFSALYSIVLSENFLIAPILDISVASNFNDLAPAGTTVSIGGGANLTWSLFSSLGAPLFLHANALVHSAQVRSSVLPGLRPETFFPFSRFSSLTTAVGAEWVLDDFIPFFEYRMTHYLNSGLTFTNTPSLFSFGSRITPLSNKSLAFLLGVDFGISRGLVPGVPFTPEWQVIGQFSYTFALFGTERKHYYTTSDVKIVDRKFIIKKNINFKVGSAELESSSSALLDEIADVIIKNDIKKLMVMGHTDSSHNEDYNLKLSIDRAKTVKNYLVAKSIPDETFMVQGYGKRRPKASNIDEAGRAANRRVEFLIVE